MGVFWVRELHSFVKQKEELCKQHTKRLYVTFLLKVRLHTIQAMLDTKSSIKFNRKTVLSQLRLMPALPKAITNRKLQVVLGLGWEVADEHSQEFSLQLSFIEWKVILFPHFQR